jgi:hypothetical protein
MNYREKVGTREILISTSEKDLSRINGAEFDKNTGIKFVHAAVLSPGKIPLYPNMPVSA